MRYTPREFNDRPCQSSSTSAHNFNTKEEDENGPILRSTAGGETGGGAGEISVGLDPGKERKEKEENNRKSPPLIDESKMEELIHQRLRRRSAMRILLSLVLFFCSLKMTYWVGFRSLIWKGLCVLLVTLAGGQYLCLGHEGGAESFPGSPKINRVFQTVMHLMFLMWDTFVVSLTWRFNHFKYALQNRCWFELFCILCHYSLISLIGFANWMLLVSVGTIYILGNLILSLAHPPILEQDERLHRIEQVFYHTTNIRSSWWADWWMGRNLSSQIEHRLFPTMNEYNRKLCRDRVKAFAEKHGLPYQECGYKDAVTSGYFNLKRLAKEIKHN